MNAPLTIDTIGPSRLARFRAGYGIEAGGVDWNGGHTFSQSAVDFGLQEYVEPEVAQKNPQLSPTDIHAEATRILALRLAQDQSFDRKEVAREEEMMTKWEVSEIDGKKQLVTRYGNGQVSLEELWRHTEEFALRVGKPEAFNRAEMQSQLAIQDALIAGRATGVAFTLSHPESVRYVQQWQQGADGAFYSTQIDIGKHAGRDLRHDEVKEFLDRVRDQYRDTAIDVEGAVAGSYVAVHGVMETAAITRTATLHTITKGGDLFGGRFHSSEHTSPSGPDASDRAFPLWVIRDRRWFGEYTREEPPERKNTPQPAEPIMTQEKQSLPQKTRLRQESSSEGTLLSKEYEARRIARNSLQIAAETGVAVHAAPLLLASLAEKSPTPIRAAEKSIRRRKKKELRSRNYELRKSKRQVGRSGERVKPLGKAKERKKRVKVYMNMMVEGRRLIPLERHKKNGVKKVAAAELLTPITPERRGRRRNRLARMGRVARRAEVVFEGKHRSKREKKRWIRKLASPSQTWRSWERQRQRRAARATREGLSSRPGLEAESLKVQKERVAIVGVRFSWMVWMLLRENNLKRFHPASQRGETLKTENAWQGETLQNQNQESSPWILLSIIWYLTMLREQGMHSNYPIIQLSNTTNSQKKQKRKTLPQHAVIFAYAS